MPVYFKPLLLVCTIIFCGAGSSNKNKSIMMEDISKAIFAAWQKGEAGNGYADFSARLDSVRFRYFSHPLLGNYQGKEALAKLMELINSREKQPNHLRFTNIIRYENLNGACFQFDSEGKVGDGFDYKGYNIIQLEIMDQKLVGFREYFGFVDPSWFK